MKITVSILTLVIACLAPRVAGAQSECGYFAGACEGTGHFFDYSSAESCFPHTYCAWCTGGACHPMCGDCGSFSMSPVLKAKLEALYAAASSGDVDLVLSHAAGLSNYVAYNRSRLSIQVRGCSGDAVVANLPLQNAAQQISASRLPTPSQMLASARATEAFSLFAGPIAAVRPKATRLPARTDLASALLHEQQ